MIQINPEDYFSQQAIRRRNKPKQKEEKPNLPTTGQVEPTPTNTNQESKLDKFYPLIVLGIIALFLITLIVIVEKK